MNTISHGALMLLLALGLTQTACTQPVPAPTPATPLPRNIIFLIGDGMGLTQVSTCFYYQESTSNFTRFKHIGLHENKPTSHRVTDSAAGATAFASGVKTYNGAIGVNRDTLPVPTITEILAPLGFRNGLISTSSLQHATPAAYYAHVTSRGSYFDITKFLPDAPLHFLAGGGRQFCHSRPDSANYFDSLRTRGYVVDTTALNLPRKFDANAKYAYILGQDGLQSMPEGRGDFLPRATQGALDYFSAAQQRFFLMVEGSQIDWGGHNNDPRYVIEEMLDFDKAIGVALDFAERDGNTLVVVTADHETGGLSLSAGSPDAPRDYNKISPTFSTGNHSATLIPVFAYGPGAAEFMGIYGNQEIFHKMLRALGVRP